MKGTVPRLIFDRYESNMFMKMSGCWSLYIAIAYSNAHELWVPVQCPIYVFVYNSEFFMNECFSDARNRIKRNENGDDANLRLLA